MYKSIKHTLKIMAACGLKYFGTFDYLERRRNVISILMFHRVNPVENPLGLSVSPEIFEEIIVFLKNRYEMISIEQAVNRLTSNNNSTTGCVLTFDDGYRDNYDFAFPVLKKHNVPATIFVTLEALQSGVFKWDLFDQAVINTEANVINLKHFGLGEYKIVKKDIRILLVKLHKDLKLLSDKSKCQIVDYVISEYGDKKATVRTMLTAGEALEMSDSGLITIGAHTITHPILSQVDTTQAYIEIVTGKAFLEDLLNLPVNYFAYPNGSEVDFNAEHMAMVKEAGYRAACSTVLGTNSYGGNIYALRRIDVTTRMCTDNYGKFSTALFMAKYTSLF